MRVHDLFDYHVRTQPARACVVDGKREFNYAELAEEVDRLVSLLRALHLAPGDRFGYLSRNSLDMVAAFLAASKSGVVLLPLNWRLAPLEWQRILMLAGARIVIAQDEFAGAFDLARPAHLEAALLIDGQREGWLDYRASMALQPSSTAAAEGDGDASLYQMYTSGTTGEPKGAVITHCAVIANATQCMLVFEPRFAPTDRALIIMPMFHAGAGSFVIGTLITGASMIIHRDFTARGLVDALSGGVTIANLVPAMLQIALAEVPDIAARDFSRLHTIIYGASPITDTTLRRAIEVFGCRFYQGYGQTETTAVLTMLSFSDHERALAGHPELLLSAGRPVAGTQVRIVDAHGHDCALNEVGEIVVRGPQLMSGYWNLPDATAAAWTDGWLRTGDAGKLDAQGYLYICDRVKDMIISGGENIYSREVENVLFSHPSIADAAVIGVPDPKYGETVMAVVALKAGAHLSGDEVVAHCRQHVAGYKCPRRVEFVDQLPRNPSGKVLKQELRAPYWRDHGRNVG